MIRYDCINLFYNITYDTIGTVLNLSYNMKHDWYCINLSYNMKYDWYCINLSYNMKYDWYRINLSYNMKHDEDVCVTDCPLTLSIPTAPL